MKKLLCLILAILLFAGMTACNVTPGPNTPGGNPNASFTPTPPDEFNPPIDDDDFDVVIGGDTGETNPPEDNPPEDNPPVDNPPVDDPPVDNPPVVNPPVVDPSLGDVPASSQVASGFVVKQKKYDHGSNNLIVLNVTNNNSENYIVTITGYYLDANGNVLKTETQTVNGYVANYEKYFSFIPEIAFDQFVFTLTAEKYSGECLDQLVSLTELWIEHRVSPTPWGEQYNDLFLRGYLWGRLDNKYWAKTTFIIIDSVGKVYHTQTKYYGNMANENSPNSTLLLLNSNTDKNGDAWIPELKDGYTIIVTHCITSSLDE